MWGAQPPTPPRSRNPENQNPECQHHCERTQRKPMSWSPSSGSSPPRCAARRYPAAVAPGAAAQHAERARRRSRRVGPRRFAVITAIIPVIDPFPHIAAHVHHAVGAGPRRVAAHRRGVSHAPFTFHFAVDQLTRRRGIAPGIDAPISAPRRLLPFRLRRQPLALPGAERLGLEPVHVDHRVVGVLRVAVVPITRVRAAVVRRGAGAGVHAGL